MTTSSVPAPRLHEAAAEEIRALMARRRMSQARLADRVGLTQSALSRRLTGEVPLTLDELERIASELDVSPGTLLNGNGGTDATQRYRFLTDRAEQFGAMGVRMGSGRRFGRSRYGHPTDTGPGPRRPAPVREYVTAA